MSDNRENPPAQVPVPQPFTRSPNYQTVYAGNFRLRVTSIDASITFMSNRELPNGIQTIQDEVAVSMPLAALKILSEHLTLTVQVLEQELGMIRVPLAARPTEQNRAGLTQALKANPLGE